MKYNFRNVQLIAVAVFVLSFTSICFGMGAGPFGYSVPQGLGSSTANFLIIIILFIVFLFPFVKAYKAAKNAEKFKTLVFVVTLYEWIGWIICITIIGIPFGLTLVLAAQSVRVLIEIEKNTSVFKSQSIVNVKTSDVMETAVKQLTESKSAAPGTCAHCGKPLEEGSRFCISCGHGVSS